MKKQNTAYDAVCAKALKSVKPTQSILPNVSVVLERLHEAAAELSVKCQIMCGGSIAKDTYLKGDYDCDIFVRFDYDEYKEKNLSDTLAHILLRIPQFSFARVNGSRDYYQFTYENISYEVIPVLMITEAYKALNVTDMSPLHVEWVVRRLNDKLRGDLRLSRAFCKSCRVYGAESYIGGFSGHVLDVLTIHYGGFISFLKASQKWKDKQIIDPMKYYAGKNALEHLNESKITSPIIVIDPILSDRNAASALTKEKCDKFTEYAKKFLAKPSDNYFKQTILEIKSFKGNVTAISVKPVAGKTDVVGAKLLQIFDFIRQEATKNGFEITHADWQWMEEKAEFFYVLKKTKISATYQVQGPPVKLTTHADRFKAAHKKTTLKAGKLFATEKREHTNFTSFLKAITKHPYIKERAIKINV